MLVQINTDNHIVGSLDLTERVRQTVETELRHVSAAITRVEVHLNDVNSTKGGSADKRCLMEARLKGTHPLSAEHRAETIDLAVDGAAVQLARVVQAALGKADTAQKRIGSARRKSPGENLRKEEGE